MGKCITSQKIIAVVDVGLLSIEEKEARGEVMVTGGNIFLAVMELVIS